MCVIDYIVLGSDSGRIVILEYHPSKNMFEKIHQETFGKSGCRRIVPGQFLAVDPKGRAVMIGIKWNVSSPTTIQDVLIWKLIHTLFDVGCNCFYDMVFFLSNRCNWETEISLHPQQRCSCKTDHLIATRSPQSQHTGLPCSWSWRGLWKPHVCLPWNGLWGKGPALCWPVS